jgi:hypothetical protein
MSPRTFGYLKNTWSIRLLATYLTTILGMNVSPMQTWRIVHDLGIVSRTPKLALEHAEDYTKKKKIVDNYKKAAAALLKKNSPGIRRRDLAKPSAIHNQYIHDESMREQQKIYHKGSNRKIYAFTTLLYPSNKIKFKISKSRTSADFINHIRSMGNYIKKNKIKRFILVTDNATFHVSRKTRQ